MADTLVAHEDDPAVLARELQPDLIGRPPWNVDTGEAQAYARGGQGIPQDAGIDRLVEIDDRRLKPLCARARSGALPR